MLLLSEWPHLHDHTQAVDRMHPQLRRKLHIYEDDSQQGMV